MIEHVVFRANGRTPTKRGAESKVRPRMHTSEQLHEKELQFTELQFRPFKSVLSSRYAEWGWDFR